VAVAAAIATKASFWWPPLMRTPSTVLGNYLPGFTWYWLMGVEAAAVKQLRSQRRQYQELCHQSSSLNSPSLTVSFIIRFLLGWRADIHLRIGPAVSSREDAV
jgi:hypothetical protein